jgi:hypothetical protein
LILNGGFETGDFTSWTVKTEAGSGGEFAVSSARASQQTVSEWIRGTVAAALGEQ